MEDNTSQPVAPNDAGDAASVTPTPTQQPIQPVAPQPQPQPETKRNWKWHLLELGIVVIVLAAGFLILHKSPANNMTTVHASANSCISKQFSLGASGNCVKDIQSMVYFLETDDLSECSFAGAKQSEVTGNFDAATKTQVEVAQTWLNCYAKQEDSSIRVDTAGIVNTSTWSELCTYAYQYPKQSGQSSSRYYKQTILAGEDAGCSN